ncbi:MAG: hypothetical protein IKX51_01820, partial [Bacteroidales bacterium]|nr:hypothetical protein [Bacteroidales bacterium]
EIARQEAENNAKQLAEKQAKEEEKRNKDIKQNQQRIAPFENALLNGNKLTWVQRAQIAKYTENIYVINKLKYDNSTNVLKALLLNPSISVEVSSKVRKRLDSKQQAKEFKKKLEQENEGGCLGVIIVFIVTSITTILSLYI